MEWSNNNTLMDTMEWPWETLDNVSTDKATCLESGSKQESVGNKLLGVKEALGELVVGTALFFETLVITVIEDKLVVQF